MCVPETFLKLREIKVNSDFIVAFALLLPSDLNSSQLDMTRYTHKRSANVLWPHRKSLTAQWISHVCYVQMPYSRAADALLAKCICRVNGG